MTTPYQLIDQIAVDPQGGCAATWTPSGLELGRGAPCTPASLVLEASAQCAGMLLHHLEGGRWLLAGIDDAVVTPLVVGEPILITAVVERQTHGLARVVCRAERAGALVGRATLLMSCTRVLDG